MKQVFFIIFFLHLSSCKRTTHYHFTNNYSHLQSENSDIKSLHLPSSPVLINESTVNQLREIVLKVHIFPHDGLSPHEKDQMTKSFTLSSPSPIALRYTKNSDLILCKSRKISTIQQTKQAHQVMCHDENKKITLKINGQDLNNLHSTYESYIMESDHAIQVDHLLPKTTYFYHGKIELIPTLQQSKLFSTVVFNLINHLPMDSYIEGVVPAEIFINWPKETVAAQSVAARTYAFYQLINIINSKPNSPFHVDDTVRYQAYVGDHYLRQKFLGATNDQLIEIQNFNSFVKETNGLVMVSSNPKAKNTREIFQAYFHAASGGYTINAQDLDFSGCDDCKSIHDYDESDIDRDPLASSMFKLRKWKYEKSTEEITRTINSCSGKKFKNFDFLKIDPNNRLVFERTKMINSKIIPIQNEFDHMLNIPFKDNHQNRLIQSGWCFKSKLLGWKSSPLYVIYKNNQKSYVVEGKGYGHSIGLSQWGAYFRAKKGYSFDQILAHYYDNAPIVNINDLTF